jgi:hypothetical protein
VDSSASQMLTFVTPHNVFVQRACNGLMQARRGEVSGPRIDDYNDAAIPDARFP